MRDTMGTGVRRILVYGMSDNPGGIETYLRNLVKQSRNKEVVWDFVTDFPRIAYKKELEEAGCRIFYIPAKSKGLLKQWKAFSEILKKHPEYKTVYFNILNAGAVFTMAVPWIYRKRIIVHSHNGSADTTRLHRLCMPVMDSMAKGFAACSRQAGEFMFGSKVMEKKQVLFVPNAIDSARYDYDPEIRKQMRRSLGVEEKYVLCHGGRIVYQKNPKGLIDIFEACFRKDKNCLLLWAGTGDMEEEARAYVKEKGLEAHVRFLGVRNDIDRLMQAADAFLLPSVYEGLPIVAIEAQAAGLPCFISDTVSEEARIVKDLVKFLPLDDVESWKEAVLQARGANRISRKNEIIEAGYDLNHQQKNLEKLLQMML